VFVTSTTYTGAMMGVAGADSRCQMRADSASLGGTWKAWLGASSNAPNVRFRWHGAYQLLDGTPVAASWPDLVDGSLLSAINRNENNLPASSLVWTGATATGVYSAAVNCGSWTTSGGTGSFGIAGSTDSSWSVSGTESCSIPKPLYCFEQ
jgi:hypothetical protein